MSHLLMSHEADSYEERHKFSSSFISHDEAKGEVEVSQSFVFYLLVCM